MNDTRKKVLLIPGEVVSCNMALFEILEILDFNSIVAKNLEDGRTNILRINDLVASEQESIVIEDINSIDDSRYKTATKRYAAIEPLLNFDTSREDVDERAAQTGVSTATLYRWIKNYNNSGSIEGLMPNKTGVKQGTKYLDIHTEQIITDVIQKVYLNKQRPSIQQVVKEVKRRCLEENIIQVPHANTIRERIRTISPYEKLNRRGFMEKARNKFKPAAGKFPNVNGPLDVVQIDHTPVDLILVDDLHRKPIGRPFLTLAIDIYSRMITGYYLSFDAPSATSVAMCVSHSVLKKEEWLTLHDVDAQWPVWGVMTTIHVDNGSDFRSKAFQKACAIHNINLEYRPVRQPQFGGHIERVLGTFMKDIHNLPGTTFSNIKQREGYNSESNAVLTISEFEKYLVTYICKVYHKSLHNGIGMTPERKWEIGIFGNGELSGAGLPAIPKNRHSFLLDFLPMYERTIQKYGVSINGLNYYADILRSWINAEDPIDRNKKRNFIFRMDPRDISTIWFYEPELKQYFKIPFADQSLPSMSIWEFEKAKTQARNEGMKSVNEHEILRAHTELIKQISESSKKTKRARKANQKIKEHQAKVTPVKPVINTKSKEEPLTNSFQNDLSFDDIQPFEDIS